MCNNRSLSSLHFSLGFVAVVLSVAAIAGAQDTRPITRPATTSDGAVPLKGKITGVRGLVEVKVNEKAAWAAAKEGMVVDEGAEFRTGPRSAVQIVIEPDQIITLDRLGTIKLLTAVRQASGKTKTDIGMKYGRTRYDISAGGLEHESTIRSPNSTLAVRGTKVSLTDTRPFSPEAVSLIGRAEFRSFKREVVAFGGKNKAKIDSAQGTAAETAFGLALLDPSIALARDPAEQALVADVISRGATVTLDRETGFRTVTGGTVPPEKQILSLFPSNLNFVLRWEGNANLDLIVGYSAGNHGGTLYPNKELFFNADGGKIPFDHQGGPSGGFEIATFPPPFVAQFPAAQFGLGINHVTGPTVTGTLDASFQGQPLKFHSFDINGNPIDNTTPTFTIAHTTPEQAASGNNVENRNSFGLVDLSQIKAPGVQAAARRTTVEPKIPTPAPVQSRNTAPPTPRGR